MRLAAWLFIIAVALLDVSLTWEHLAAFDLYEANPIAVWLFHKGGFWLLLAYRAAWIGFAYWASTRPGNWAAIVLPVWFTTHAALLLLLVFVLLRD
jgi:hypothetical protein